MITKKKLNNKVFSEVWIRKIWALFIFEIANIYLRGLFWFIRSPICRLVTSPQLLLNRNRLAWYSSKLSDKFEKKFLLDALTLLKSQLPPEEKVEFVSFINHRSDYPYSFKENTVQSIWKVLISTVGKAHFFDVVVTQNLVSAVIWRMQRTLEDSEVVYIDKIWDCFCNQEIQIPDVSDHFDLRYSFIQFLIDELSFERIEKEYYERKKEIESRISNEILRQELELKSRFGLLK